jgi:GNAT superfamily N-acetyltransferase
MLKAIAWAVQQKFPGLEMIFGDEDTVARFCSVIQRPPARTVRFIFMHTEGAAFAPIMKHGGVVPGIEQAPLLVPLQVQYEIEEIGAGHSAIDRKKVLRVLEKKIRRAEISAIFIQGRPVALAGVNARFEKCCQIGSVYVMPQFRNEGYGHSIVSFHVQRLLQKYMKIALFVQEKNRVARSIYEHLGFSAAGTLIQSYL